MIEAAAIRLRPVLMTSLCTAFGALPLMLAHGAGAESRKSIGAIVFYGVMVSLLLTLYVVPGAVPADRAQHALAGVHRAPASTGCAASAMPARGAAPTTATRTPEADAPAVIRASSCRRTRHSDDLT